MKVWGASHIKTNFFQLLKIMTVSVGMGWSSWVQLRLAEWAQFQPAFLDCVDAVVHHVMLVLHDCIATWWGKSLSCLLPSFVHSLVVFCLLFVTCTCLMRLFYTVWLTLLAGISLLPLRNRVTSDLWNSLERSDQIWAGGGGREEVLGLNWVELG